MKAKLFEELTTKELYEIVRSRTEIFLLEQKIICQDFDGVDYEALHCFIEKEGRNGIHSERGGKLDAFRFFHADLADDQIRVCFRKSFQFRGELLAGTAPGRPEVDQYGLSGLLCQFVKRFLIQMQYFHFYFSL